MFHFAIVYTYVTRKLRLEVHCTSFHYLHAAPFVSLYAGYAGRCYAGFRFAALRGACRWMRAALATRKRVVSFIMRLAKGHRLSAKRIITKIFLKVK